ncbi:unnamed protein product, partial [Closterium sp. NIES-54]
NRLHYSRHLIGQNQRIVRRHNDQLPRNFRSQAGPQAHGEREERQHGKHVARVALLCADLHRLHRRVVQNHGKLAAIIGTAERVAGIDGRGVEWIKIDVRCG